MRRLFWALLGLGLGAAVGVAVARWAGRAKQRYSPANLARGAGAGAEAWADRVRDAIEEGRREMELREAELRAELGLDA